MKFIIIIVSLSFLLPSVYSNISQFNARKQTLSLDSIHLPNVRQITLANGLTIYLKQVHDLPLIRATAHLKIGSSSPLSGKHGLTTLLRALIRKDLHHRIAKIKGYTVLRHPFPRIHSMESHDIPRIEMDGIYDLSDVSSRKLFEKTAQGFAKALFSTDITKDRVIKYKKHLVKQPDIWMNKPDLYIKYFSRDHLNDPYFSPNTYIQAVQKITLQDVLNLHRTHIKPNTTVLTITGSFNMDGMILILKKAFSSWEKGKLNDPDQVSKRIHKKVFIFVPRNTIQTHVYLGAGTFKCPHSDYTSLILANYILGQMAHTNRLYRKIRSELGLVYSIRSRLRMSPFENGTIEIVFQCDPKQVVRVINRVNQILRQFINGPISADELLQAKLNYIYNYPVQLNSSRRYLASLAEHKLLGFPSHFNYTMIDRLKSISQKDILKVARKYFSPKRFSIILIGKKLNWKNPEVKEIIQTRRLIKQ